MKIMLIAPRSSYWKSQFIFSEPLGLSYIGAAARKAGHDVRIVQQLTPTEPTDSAIVDELREYQPDFVGISVLSDSYEIGRALVRRIRPHYRGPVIWGGKHVSLNPDIVADEEVDVGLIGEGEDALIEIVERWDGTLHSLSEIPGIAYCNGEMHQNGIRPRIKDLDSLEFPLRDGLSMHRYRMVNLFAVPATMQRMGSCLSSRGCVYTCTFCPTPNLSARRWYARSAENVVAEIEDMRARFDCNFVLFHDEDVLLNPKRSRELCGLLVEKGIARKMKWGCETNISNINDELLDQLVESGCVFISFGIESGSEESLEKMHKKINLKQVGDTLRRVQKRGIQTNGNIIIGFPWEDRETIMKGYEVIQEWPLDTLALNVLIPLKGSELYEIALKENLMTDPNFHNWHQKQAVMNTRHLKAGEVDRLYRLLNRRFYFRLRYFWQLFVTGLKSPIKFLGMAEIFWRSLLGRAMQY